MIELITPVCNGSPHKIIISLWKKWMVLIWGLHEINYQKDLNFVYKISFQEMV